MSQSLEFHQLDRRLERLRVRHPAHQRRLIASLAETGQQTPIIVIKQANSYLVIDGHKRIAALQTLGRDTVQAVVWDMSEAEALLLERSLRMSEHFSTLITEAANEFVPPGGLIVEIGSNDPSGIFLRLWSRRSGLLWSWVSERPLGQMKP